MVFNKNTCTWTGSKITPLYHPNVTVGQVILHALERNCHKICQVIFKSKLMAKIKKEF